MIGHVAWDETTRQHTAKGPARSPGLIDRHYAPRAKLHCVKVGETSAVQELLARPNRVGWLRLHPEVVSNHVENVAVIDMPSDPSAYSARLYAALHELDDAGVDQIVVDLPPEGDAWLAVHDRLKRASAK